MHPSWLSIASDVLEARTASTGRRLLADALTRHFGAREAVRLSPGADGQVRWHFFGPTGPPPKLPTAADVRAHPLHQFHAETLSMEPIAMPEAILAGWSLRRRTREIIERLHLTMHQVSVPIEPPSALFTAWIVVSDEPLSPAGLQSINSVHGLIRGLDRHLELLGEEPPPAPPLTPRELLILGMLAKGSTARGIAARLLVSPRTVHKHQEHLYRKLGARDRLSAVLRAQELGLLPLQPFAPGPTDHPSRSATHVSNSVKSRTPSSSNWASVR